MDNTGKIKGNERLTSQRQQEILDAALRVFAKKGFSGATTREIAHEAGVAEGTIFRYFKTKKDILFNLMGPYIVQSLADTIEEVSGETDEIILKAILKNRLSLIRGNIDLLRLLLTEAQFHPEIREQFVEKVALKAAVILEQFIAKRIEAGIYRGIDPGVATRALVGMVGVFVVWKEFLLADKYVSFDDDLVIEQVVDLFLNGIRVNKCKLEVQQ